MALLQQEQQQHKHQQQQHQHLLHATDLYILTSIHQIQLYLHACMLYYGCHDENHDDTNYQQLLVEHVLDYQPDNYVPDTALLIDYYSNHYRVELGCI